MNTRKVHITRLTWLTVAQGLMIAFTWIVGGIPHTRFGITGAIVAHMFFVLSVIITWHDIDDER